MTIAELSTLKKQNDQLRLELQQAKTKCCNLQTLNQKTQEKMKTSETENAQLRKYVEEINEKLKGTTQSLESNQLEVTQICQLLKESEFEKHELLELLDSSNHSTKPESRIPRPRGQVVFDNVTNTETSHEITELVQLKPKQIGRVIGSQGSTISRLRKKHSVIMRIGRWSEPKKDKRNEMDEKTDAVIISGLSCNVKAAATSVRQIIHPLNSVETFGNKT